MSRTAFEEALMSSYTGDDESPSGVTIPSYITSSDTLSAANGNGTFLESAVDTVDSIQKFIGVSMISGANQLYNVPASVGNLFGMDNELSQTEEVVANIDDDLSVFYQDHKQGADLVGFMVSSLVPGLGSIKVLNAGQKALQGAIGAGKFGSTTGRALGLLAPSRQKTMARAVKEVAEGSAPASIANANAMRAIGAGMGQNALEALAFEIGVTATLYDSPILENQDFGDFVSNVAWGAGVFSVIGGAVDAAKISSKLNKVADIADLEARPWTYIGGTAKASKPYESIAINADQLNSIPKIPEGLGEARTNLIQAAAQRTKNTLRNELRASFGTLAKKDNEVGDVMYETFLATNKENQLANTLGLTSISRMGVRSAEVRDIERIEREIAKGAKSNLDLDSPEVLSYIEGNKSIGYIKAFGDDVGTMYQGGETPTLTRIIDTLSTDESIKITKSGVSGGKYDFKFNTRGITGKTAGSEDITPWRVSTTTNKFEVDARYQWAEELPPLLKSLKKPNDKLTIDLEDIPMLEKLYRENPDALLDPRISITGQVGSVENARLLGLREFIAQQKVFLANKFAREALEPATASTIRYNQEEIAAIVNLRNDTLGGILDNAPTGSLSERDLFGFQSYADDYNKRLIEAGVRTPASKSVDLRKTPQHIRAVYDSTDLAIGREVDNHWVKNLVHVKEMQRVYKDGLNRAAASPNVLGTFYDQFEDIASEDILKRAVRSGSGPELVSSANGNYGSLASVFENIGQVGGRAIAAVKEYTHDMLDGAAAALGRNREAAIEFAVKDAQLRSYPVTYVFDEAGEKLIPGPLKKYLDDVAEGKQVSPPDLPPGIPEEVVYNTAEARELARVHIQRNGQRVLGHVELKAAQGSMMNRDPLGYYPIPVNPKNYKHFAFVIDESVTSTGHSKMLYASSEEELRQMANKVASNDQFRVLYKKDAEDYYKARGRWEYEKTINSNYIDTATERLGTSSAFTVPTDPQKIVDDFMNWHMDRDTGLIREGISAKYEIEFEELKRLGDQFTAAGTSKFSDQSLLTYAEESVKNPFADYIKTALGVKKTSDYPWWISTNRLADQAVSSVVKKATALVEARGDTAALEKVNAMLKKAGYRGPSYDSTMEIFANSKAAQGVLTNAVQKANSVLATVVLRLDTLNAINNAVSANVLLGAETKAIFRAMESADDNALGALAQLTRLKVPGTEKAVFNSGKLIANSMKKFHAEGLDGPTMKFYKDHGFITNISTQYKNTLDDLTFGVSETVPVWNNRIDKTVEGLRTAVEKGEKWTGNRLAEEFNRFVAADVMKQMTDIAVSAGVIQEKQAMSYINSFVNRTQGNYLSSQRPLMFSGPIGQAMGLFQTYQFNLMQQLLRHVGEGHAKDAMTLLALQGTIHGMNGLPAFNAVNTHIIGNASGNEKHRDAYDAMYGIVGKEAGDWLTYGVASNALGLLHPDLKINLYTRGDLNPRHVTVVPTNPADVPFIQAGMKVFSNIARTASKLGAGGDVATSLLQGLEHNGISRPLAGIAQTLEAATNPNYASYSTSKRGNVTAANDFLSMANFTRVIGGKPLDEAIALDATFRFKAYGLKDAKRRNVLGMAIKSHLIANGSIDQNQIEDFSQKYMEAGGRQEEFARWMTQLYKTANTSQANEIQRSLKSPFTQAMQEIMGGEQLRDFESGGF